MRGPINYVGGKNRLAKVIIERIPDHLTYVEPFSGGAQVFFRKPRSTIEVLNDLDSELVNFYRVCQNHTEELIRYMRCLPVSRQWFDDFKRQNTACLTDIQRASRFLYLQKLAYGGRVTRKAFGIHIEEKPNLRDASVTKSLTEVHARLAGVQIEHLPYDEVIQRYDRAGSFFYIDPPYYDIQLYNYNLEHDDFLRMAELLSGIKGKFLLSLNDHPKVREIFSSFCIEEVKIAYSLHSTVGRRHQELLISNYEPTITSTEKAVSEDDA